MAVIAETAASLRFFDDNLDPDEVTRLLRGLPTHCARKGELTGPRQQIVARQGSWRRVAGHQRPGNPELQIRALFRGLTLDLSIWQQLSSRFNGNVFVGMFMAETNEGYEFSSQTLLLLAERNLSLQLDIYSGANEWNGVSEA